MTQIQNQPKQSHLLRRLGLKESIALVIGTVIGTGVFLKTAVMSQNAGSPGWVMIAWLVAGVLSFTGALTYAELGALYPRAGGEYAFLREGYGPIAGFLFGWMRFWIGSPGSIAAYAVGAATFLGRVIPEIDASKRPLVAISLILFFSLLNCLSVAFGGRVQTFMTSLKITAIVGLTLMIFVFAEPHAMTALTSGSIGIDGDHWRGWSAFGMAVVSALWAFDGWNNLAMAAGEIENPTRNIPRALGIGMLAVFIVYISANAAYFYALPFAQVLTASSTAHPAALPVATLSAQAVFGPSAGIILSLAFVLSAVGALNGSVLTSSRVPYAMAHDGLFFRALAKVNPRSHVPVVAVLVQGAWSCVLALSGTFDQLTDYVIFASWIFYVFATASVFKIRKHNVGKGALYRTPGFPVVPILFILCATLLLINTLINSPRDSLIGLAFMLSGIPVYLVFAWRLKKSAAN